MRRPHFFLRTDRAARLPVPNPSLFESAFAPNCQAGIICFLFIALLVGFSCFASPALAGTNGTWISTAFVGLWSAASNWSAPIAGGSGIIANGIDGVADFSTLNIVKQTEIVLDSPRTIGTLRFGDTMPSNDWTLYNNGSSANNLTLAVSSGTPIIRVDNRTAAIYANLAGTQGFTKSGGGTLELAGGGSIAGVTTVASGTLQFFSSAALQNSTLAIDGPSTLEFDTTSVVLGGLTGSSNLAISSRNTYILRFQVGSDNDSTTYSGVLSGTGTLTKVGTGILTLSGANSYTGATTINNGALSLANADALQNSTVSIPSPAGNIQFRPGIGTFTFGGLTINSPLSLTDSSGAGITLVVGNNNQDTNLFAGLGGSGSLTKIGSGQLSLVTKNTYTGATTVDAGTLSFGKIGGLVNNGSNKVFVAAGIDFSAASLVRTVGRSASYAGFGSTVVGGVIGYDGSSTDIRVGQNQSNGVRNLAMQWRVRNASDGVGVISDVLNLTGMSSSTGTHVQAGPFALQMTYSPTALNGQEGPLAAEGLIALAWLDMDLNQPNGLWQNAIAGNFGTGLPGDVFQNVQSSWDAFAATNSITDSNVGNFLGSYGVDVTSHSVWAVVNHNSLFAVVPEPSSLMLLTISAIALGGFEVFRRRAC